jgi:hypothetical protein
MAVSGGGQQAAAGQQPAAVLVGGTRWKLAGERQNALPCTKLNGNKTKPKLSKRETHLGLGKKENSRRSTCWRRLRLPALGNGATREWGA